MKETLKALAAGLGCTPMIAVGLFVAGVLVGEIIPIELLPPPQWLLIPASLFPVCFGLYLRAYVLHNEQPHWLDLWRRHRRQRKVVGYPRSNAPLTVEDAWLDQVKHGSPRHFLARIFDNPEVWGWAAFITFLPLAYICGWYGLFIA